MEAIKDLILGDPLYDCKGRVIRRNFGIKNIFIILVIVYGLYSLRGKMGIKSGRRKLRGGSEPPPEAPTTREPMPADDKSDLVGGFIANIPTIIGFSIIYLTLRSWK
tara:strand:+ start:343 stop:663 length:321 start_codon:yes stop_codon:yes gene_type:complete